MKQELLEKNVSVKNRGFGEVIYSIPEISVRRVFAPNETKRNISVKELEQLSFIPGGMKLIQKYLLISDKEIAEELGLDLEPEYFYAEEDIKNLLQHGTIESFLDCLDFAPAGVLDILKNLAVELELNDYQKREAIKTSLGFDVTRAIDNNKYSKEVDEKANNEKVRRVAMPAEPKAAEVKPQRRVIGK